MLVIEVFDISRELDEEDLELLEYVKRLGKVIIVLNKSDLENVVERSQLEKYSDYVIEISAKLDEGREELQKATEKLLGIGGYDADSTILQMSVKYPVQNVQENILPWLLKALTWEKLWTLLL